MGTLVPPWYKLQPTSQTGLLVAAFFWGSSMTVAAFDSGKAARQTRRSWKRSRKVNAYIIMIWTEIAMCITSSITSWLFLQGYIPPQVRCELLPSLPIIRLTRPACCSVWYFTGMLVLWTIQIQCLMQILANRLSLILYNPVKARRLKVGLGIAIGIINVSVFCIWVPARLQISATWIRINSIWDRMEKAIFACIDTSLNLYFMWLVKSKLVEGGLTQYKLVYQVNLVLVWFSISLDILLIGLMSLRDDAVYVQVHPLTYLAKLHIEMNMAELLGKVIKKSQRKSSVQTADVYHGPQLGVDMFDWLGSAKNLIMPQGGQMHDLNMDILNEPTLSEVEKSHHPVGQGNADARTSEATMVHGVRPGG
ncbi:hypothetical protein MFIFM68171_09599 [Madurella fahalii]|uniref:Uncharacterized protein n=1 Tax=Madurella fahalii TaxID=1157608 RepID=A0ABQ0GNT1_9PEZI